MIVNEIFQVLTLVRTDNLVKSIFSITVIFCCIFAFVASPLAASILFLNYILGIIVCWVLTKYQDFASFYLQRFVSFYRMRVALDKSDQLVCNICNGKNCSRHKIAKRTLPWKKFKINKKLNTSVIHFYEKLIENFVESWYGTFTNDTSFLNEIKYSLRYATASAACKISEIDVGSLIANKLIPCAIKHIDDYLCMQQIAKLKSVHFDKITAEYLGRRLHIAVTNRQKEISYLRHLTECLMPNLLPEEYLKCSNYSILLRELFAGWILLPITDALAHPNIINQLVIIGLTYKSKDIKPQHDEEVEMLSDFIKKDFKFSTLASNMKDVLKDSSILYHFMQFLKREGNVHLLQFCLDIEEFNNKLITPDLSKRQLESLHVEAYNIYKIYINDCSPDYIGCPQEISKAFSELLEGGMYNVARLRTSEPLFQAYDYAYSVLESEYLPDFHHSNEFYNYLCGSKVNASYKKSAIKNNAISGSPIKIRSRKYYETGANQGTVAKISSGLGKLKGVLQTKQPIEGYYTPESHAYESDASHFIDEVVPQTPVSRDLSTWRISIHVKYLQHNRSMQVFIITVDRLDATDPLSKELKSWAIQRKDNDFFLLKAKLIEFHGESVIADHLLPSKRSLCNADAETRRQKYDYFLKQLLQKPSLKSSDLLYMFLTSEQNFAEIMLSSVTSVDLENIYQSVTYKLRKEKGQHLDSFMNTFILSLGKVKYSKVEWAQLVDEVENVESNVVYPKTYKNVTFGDNYEVFDRKIHDGSSSSFTPIGICESLFYLLKHSFKVRYSVLKLYTAICNIGRQAFESLCRILIERKIKSALCQPNLASLVELLEGIVFDRTKKSHHNPQTESRNSEEQREKAFELLNASIPNWLLKILGNDFKHGLKSLLEILQNPLYNKQLVYNLLDIIIVEMFPHIDSIENESEYSTV
ncbi:sorting nexin-14-like isoform X2 [Onthophagus taurus]|uniref:sorting nexin-14-like isoform X2 n=1 Tax=Onthophagus taurus TaxID=166361 RepID=UPI0039BDBB5D